MKPTERHPSTARAAHHAPPAQPERRTRLWYGLGWALLAAVVWFSLIPNPPDSGVHQGDKLHHLLAYLALMAWWGQLLRQRGRLVLALVLLGAVLEGLQGLTPLRQPSLADMLANTAGVMLGWLITRAWPDWLGACARRLGLPARH